MISTYVFTETSPSSAGTRASSQSVQNTATWAGPGVAGGSLDNAASVDIIATLKGATGGTLDVYVQTATGQYDGSGNLIWTDAIHFPQLAAGAASVTYRATLTAVTQPASAAPVVVGGNLTPALAASTVVQSVAFDRLRLVFVAGSGTTAGAAVTVVVAAALGR